MEPQARAARSRTGMPCAAALFSISVFLSLSFLARSFVRPACQAAINARERERESRARRRRPSFIFSGQERKSIIYRSATSRVLLQSPPRKPLASIVEIARASRSRERTKKKEPAQIARTRFFRISQRAPTSAEQRRSVAELVQHIGRERAFVRDIKMDRYRGWNDCSESECLLFP